LTTRPLPQAVLTVDISRIIDPKITLVLKAGKKQISNANRADESDF
jgi:hypothetical protein